jgi:hypothetical protein
VPDLLPRQCAGEEPHDPLQAAGQDRHAFPAGLVDPP